MSIVNQRDIGALVTEKPAAFPPLGIAASTDDGVEWTGAVIDRMVTGKGLANSAVLNMHYKASLAITKTFTMAATMQDSSGSTETFADLTKPDTTDVVEYTSRVVEGSTSTQAAVSDELGVVSLKMDLSNAKRYIKAQVSQDCSAASSTGGDKAQVAVTITLGGFTNNPVV